MTEIEAKKYAEETALKLANKVGGKWKIRVWHNLHWCCEVMLGSISVVIDESLPLNSSLKYSAYIGSEKNEPCGAYAVWSDDDNYNQTTPEKAVENAMKFARKYVLEVTDNISTNFDKMPLLRKKMKADLK